MRSTSARRKRREPPWGDALMGILAILFLLRLKS